MPSSVTIGPKSNKAKRVRIGVLGVALAATLAACGSSSPTKSTGAPANGSTSTTSAAPVSMNIEVYSGVYYTWLAFIANAEGFYAKNHINANIIPVTGGGSVAFAALANGSADVAMGDLSLAGPLMEKGEGISVISGAVRAGWELVAPSNYSGPTTYPASIKALAGKPVGVVALGTSSYYFLQQLITAAGLGPNGVTYEALGGLPANFVSALDAHRVTATIADPAVTYYLTTAQHDKVIYNFNDPAQLKEAGSALGSLAGYPGGWMFASNSWMSSNPAAVKRFQLSMEEADVWVHNPANLQKAISVLQSEKNLPAFAQGAAAAPYLEALLPDLISYIPAGAPQAYMNFWVKAGLLPKALPVSQWYSSSIPTSAAEVVAQVKAAGEGSLGSSA